MDSRQPQGMWRNYVIFLAISFAILLGNMYFFPQAPPPKPEKKQAAVEQKEPAGQDAAAKKAEPAKGPEQDKKVVEAPGNEAPPAKAPPAKEEAVTAAPAPPQQYLAFGSADPNSPYRMLVIATNRGAALASIELNSQRYRDLDYRGGYMGHLLMDPKARGDGAAVQVVGTGTPAAKAGIRPGDVIRKINGFGVTGYESFDKAMQETRPDQQVQVELVRDGKPVTLPVTLARRPMQVIRPENQATVPDPLKASYATASSPLSFLTTLKQIDDQKLPDFSEAAQPEKDRGDWPRPELADELKGVNLREGNWEVVSHTQSEVVFRQVLPKWGLEVRKTYRLVEVPQDKRDDPDYKAYHLAFNVEVRNTGKQTHKVAVQQDGPNGLPLEGYWYAYKVGRTWSAVGLRDVVFSFNGGTPALIGAPAISRGSVDPPYQGDPLTFVGVDAQYFSAVMIPQTQDPSGAVFAESQAMRVGPVNPDWSNKLTNTSFRVTTKTEELKPGQSLTQNSQVFAGPKRPDLLAQYGLGGLVYYGWFGWVAQFMAFLLHAFYSVVRNYGIAIILLTVLVRGCMFPFSIKQAAGAAKMAQIQPELKKLQEKYKGDMEGRNRAQRELFRKHNYNPASGCLVMLFQLPVFVGLYRALMVDVELRQAPLFSEAVRWCSNLAAPDMFFNWTPFLPTFITSGNGFFGLGPYFNLLPILTIILFIWQQKKLMPPPTDEQTAMQQKVMQYMMIFMGILFFKVASGLCLYFIASSLWSIAERKFLPKVTPATSGEPAGAKEPPASRVKNLASKLLPGASNGDDVAARRKKRTRPKR